MLKINKLFFIGWIAVHFQNKNGKIAIIFWKKSAVKIILHFVSKPDV
jgi:hypothetical protein